MACGSCDSWSNGELGKLKRAVELRGRDWPAVASIVGSKTREQCLDKVTYEVAVGRMQEPGGKLVQESWSKNELGALKNAVTVHGRDWAAVASSVGSKTQEQCKDKVAKEFAAGRMQEPGGKRVQDSWSKTELGALKRAVVLYGRGWTAVSSSVGSKTGAQCQAKVAKEVAAGRMQEPGGKRVQDSWSEGELNNLKRAVTLHGRRWVAVASMGGGAGGAGGRDGCGGRARDV